MPTSPAENPVPDALARTGRTGFVQLKDLTGAARGAVDPASPVLKAADASAWQDAQTLLAQASVDAQDIRAQAKAAFDAECKRGYEEGFEQANMEMAERMIENAGKMVDFFASVEQRMVGLVMVAMRRIVGEFSDTERVMTVVRSGLAVMRNQKQLTLRLAPAHSDEVRLRAHELLENFPGIGMLDIVGDSRLKGDAAILESEIGVVEASLEMQLRALEQGFKKMLGSRV